jgi:serine/threonine-protein kinase
MIDLQPDNPLGYQDLGAVYMQMGRYDDAVSLMKKGLTLKESSDLLSNLGSAYMLSGKYAEAVPIMERAAQLAPHNHDLWRNVADSYRQVPELAPRAPAAYEKALQTAHEELSVNPKSSGALSGIALYEAHLKRRAQAERDIRKAIEAAPNDSEVLFTSALVYEIIGRREIALASLDQANKAGYSIAVIEREPELAALRKDPRYQHWLKQRSAPS